MVGRQFRFPAELLERLDRLIPERERSAYMRAALEAALEKDEKEALIKALGDGEVLARLTRLEEKE